MNVSHIVPERPPNTRLLVESRQSDEAKKYGDDEEAMMMDRGQWANLARMLGFQGHPGIFNDHRESSF